MSGCVKLCSSRQPSCHFIADVPSTNDDAKTSLRDHGHSPRSSEHACVARLDATPRRDAVARRCHWCASRSSYDRERAIASVASSLAPSFLLSMPQLIDPNFKQTVVLLCRHNAQGNTTVCLKLDRKSTRLNSSHRTISYAVFCLKKKKKKKKNNNNKTNINQ